MKKYKLKNRLFYALFKVKWYIVSSWLQKRLYGLEMWQIEQLCYILPIIIRPF